MSMSRFPSRGLATNRYRRIGVDYAGMVHRELPLPYRRERGMTGRLENRSSGS
jgi:hypothetical protein